jgi:flagellar biosynthesis protein FlhB
MADGADRDSKTEEPTEKKLRDAVEQGNVPFSREAATLTSFLGILFVTSFFFVGNVARFNLVLRRYLDNPAAWSLENSADAVALFEDLIYEAARLLIPVVVVLTTAGMLASFLQNAPSVVLDRIKPQLSRLSIARGWSRLMGRQGQVEFLKSLFKFGVLTLLAFIMLRAGQKDVLSAMFMEPSTLPALILTMATRLVCMIIVATIALVAADLVWSRVFWQHELRMTRQEVKDEHKQSDGDPIVKGRLRSLARDRQRKRMIAAVQRATLVITNPTHYAVALRYVREEGGAPMVVAKGQDLIALKIREVAMQHDVPIFEDKALARSLYKAVEVDKMIPTEFYKAVAAIVYFILARKGGARPA